MMRASVMSGRRGAVRIYVDYVLLCNFLGLTNYGFDALMFCGSDFLFASQNRTRIVRMQADEDGGLK